MTKRYSTLFKVFTGRQAYGNSATVLLVDNLPEDNTCDLTHTDNTTVYLQSRIEGHEYEIRWFNSNGRIQRCGHGTLAAAAFLQQLYKQSAYLFHSATETLHVKILQDRYSLTLPIEKLRGNASAIFSHKRAAQTNNEKGYLIAELDSEQQVRKFRLNPAIVESIRQRALIITAKMSAKGSASTIIFRYFAPQYGIEEDSATGSAASVLWPFWNESLGKQPKNSTLLCYQASTEGGRFEIKKRAHELTVIGRVKAILE